MFCLINFLDILIKYSHNAFVSSLFDLTNVATILEEDEMGGACSTNGGEQKRV
jgi:hypothetical protein